MQQKSLNDKCTLFCIKLFFLFFSSTQRQSTLLRNPFRMDAAFTESDRGILIVFSKMTEMKKEIQLKKKDFHD